MENKRINIVTTNKLHDMMKEQASQNGMSMSAWINHLVLNYQEQQKAKNQMFDMLNQMKPFLSSPDLMKAVIEAERNNTSKKVDINEQKERMERELAETQAFNSVLKAFSEEQ